MLSQCLALTSFVVQCSSTPYAVRHTHTKIDYTERKKNHTRQPVPVRILYYVCLVVSIQSCSPCVCIYFDNVSWYSSKGKHATHHDMTATRSGLARLACAGPPCYTHTHTHGALVLVAKQKHAEYLTHDLTRKMCVSHVSRLCYVLYYIHIQKYYDIIN